MTRLAIALSEWKGMTPDNTSYMIRPTVKISELALSSLHCACSGDMYSIVPSMVPVRVIPSPANERASPKSITTTRPFLSRMMLPGFKSR